MSKYYRFTNKNTPMSEWGHAMFAENRDDVMHYGRNEYVLDKAHTVDIYDLEDEIKAAWVKSQEEDEFGEMYDDYYKSLSADEVFECFVPEDIVNSAAGYDCDLVVWLWQFILEPKGIMAVRTPDGAVCFDESLIERVG